MLLLGCYGMWCFLLFSTGCGATGYGASGCDAMVLLFVKLLVVVLLNMVLQVGVLLFILLVKMELLLNLSRLNKHDLVTLQYV